MTTPIYAFLLLSFLTYVKAGDSETQIQPVRVDHQSSSMSSSTAKITSRALRGTSSSKDRHEVPVTANILNNEVIDQLEESSPSAVPIPATAWSSLPPAGSGIWSATNTMPPSPNMPPTSSPSHQLGDINVPTFQQVVSSSASPQPSLSGGPTDFPSLAPSLSMAPTDFPSDSPSLEPSDFPSLEMSDEPSDLPSDAPSDVPTSPSIEDTISTCNLVANVDCRLYDGSPCSTLSAITNNGTSTCTGSSPYEIEWLYMAGSCDESTTNQELFECRDESGGPSSVFLSYITVTGMTSMEEYVSKTIFKGVDGFPVQSVVVSAESNEPLDEKIKVVVSKGSPPDGEILQEMLISTACNELTIGDTFGALQLASYQSNESSSATEGFVDTTWIYTARNAGGSSSVLKSMSTSINGDSTTISPEVELLPGGEYHVIAHETISLVHSTTVSGRMTLREENSDGVECVVESEYSVIL